MTEELENRQPIVDSEGRELHDPSGGLGPAEPAHNTQELVDERDELKDLLLRKQAEFENFRKRTEKERTEFVQYATSEVMREMLNVLDSFELALNSGDGETLASHKGFELIYKQLIDSLSRAGLEVIEAKGTPFDPNIHEAVSTQPAPEGVGEGTVLSELRRGYLLHGKLLRPTMVMVAAAGGEGGGE
jgi:molecular chaperone GrpE